MKIRTIIPLSKSERTALAERIRASAEAAAIAKSVVAEAEPLLGKSPRPLVEIYYEGLLDTDPRRIETQKNLEDMDRLAVLSNAWTAARNARFVVPIKALILAWAGAYVPTGNAINENKLLPLVSAYSMLREEDGTFSAAERRTTDDWLRRIAVKQQAAGVSDSKPGVPKNNWHSKRLRMIGMIGLLLGDRALVRYALDGARQYVADSLFPDGTSVDLKQRDALSYHVSGIEPLVTLAALAEEGRGTLYEAESASGSSLRRSLEFVVPYATGVLRREEWKNTKVDLDRRRAAAGLAEYQPGKPYNPENAIDAISQAAYFDPTLVRVVSLLEKSTAVHYPNWLTLLGQVRRETKEGRK